MRKKNECSEALENQYCLKSDAGGQVLLILAKRNSFLAIFSSAAAFFAVGIPSML